MGNRDREPVRINTFDQVGAAFVRAHPHIGIPSLASDREAFEIFQSPIENPDEQKDDE